jgi:acyl-CoA thioester hydrolase
MADPAVGPLILHRDQVRPEWIDYNGHLNLAYYVLIFDYATDAFLEVAGITESFRASENASTFSAEIHVNYLRELREGDPVRITTQLLNFDDKRIHYFHCMYHEEAGYLAATNELLSLYMDMGTRRVTCMPAQILKRLGQLKQQHALLTRPEQAGRVICVPDRSVRD